MKRVLTLLSVVVMMFAIAGCGGKTDEELLQGTVWELTEITEEKPDLFPVSTAQASLSADSFQVEFLSDGSLIINAYRDGEVAYNSEAYYSYALVDGRIKIVAPLGSTCISEYEISSKELKLSDSNGYAVFKPFDGKESASVKPSESATEKVTEVAEEAEEKEIETESNIAEVEQAGETSVVDDGEIANWETVSYDDYNPSLLGQPLNIFYTVDDVMKIWETNKSGPGCYQPEIGLANCVYAWQVVEGELRTKINIKLKDGYSFSDMPELRANMLDVTITDACYAWCPQEEGEEWGYEPLPDVTVDPKDIQINNFAFNPENPYIQIIIPDMYDAYNSVEAGQYYVVNWRYND